VESNSKLRKLSFVLLNSRLIQLVNLRVQKGDFTERGLARILGLSQSHVHNVLKGARKLKPELADHMMSRLDIGVLDLLEPGELRARDFSAVRARDMRRTGAHGPVIRAEDSQHPGELSEK
jgi:transcriptional regulator with XRE-family HTH domain